MHTDLSNKELSLAGTGGVEQRAKWTVYIAEILYGVGFQFLP